MVIGSMIAAPPQRLSLLFILAAEIIVLLLSQMIGNTMNKLLHKLY